MMQIRSTLGIAGLLLLCIQAGAQRMDSAGSASGSTSISAEDLFRQARALAFEAHDRAGARVRLREALTLSPNDPDMRIFLGRLYTWDRMSDSARAAFDRVVQSHPAYEEVYLAYSDLEYWDDHNERALSLCDLGLAQHPGSAALLQRRATILSALRRFTEARNAADSALARDGSNTQLRALIARIRDYAALNKIGVSYDYVYFDKQYSDAWQLVSVDYTRQTTLGSVAGRINYANRFRTGGAQGEIDAYPHISKTFYGYLNFGYAGDAGVFPKYRGGTSLYANLPHAFEADAGVRYLYFGTTTWVYTFSVGKYYRSFWFNARAYLVPANSAISQSVNLTGRWYYGGADDYISLALGTGISPDDRSNNQQLASPYKLRSRKGEAGYRRSIGRMNVLFANLQWLDQEYLPKTHGNQIDIGVGYQRRF